MENHHDKQKYNWETTGSLDSFAIAKETDGNGKCGYDAPYRGLKDLGLDTEDLPNYGHYLFGSGFFLFWVLENKRISQNPLLRDFLK